MSTVRFLEARRIRRGIALDILVAHPGHRLVEEKHLGVERQRRRDLKRALAAIRELDGRVVAEIGKADLLDQVQRVAVHLVEHTLRAPEVEAVAALALERDADVLQNGQVPEHGRDLEGAHEAEPGDVRRLHLRDVAALVVDGAAARLEELREEIEAGRLARPVRPDQSMDGAALHPQVDLADRRETLEIAPEPARRQNDVVSHSDPWSSAFPGPSYPSAAWLV
jgi:hypothetical protein